MIFFKYFFDTFVKSDFENQQAPSHPAWYTFLRREIWIWKIRFSLVFIGHPLIPRIPSLQGIGWPKIEKLVFYITFFELQIIARIFSRCEHRKLRKSSENLQNLEKINIFK